MLAGKNRVLSLVVGAVLVLVAQTVLAHEAKPVRGWSSDETAVLRGLWIGSLIRLPSDPSNVVGDDPRAVAFGHRLFFDTRLSANGKVACATCHQPERAFADRRPLAHGVGTARRNAMTILGTGYSPWFFWDGRADSQWAQALGPMESAVEHGGTRTQYAHLVVSDRSYRTTYEDLFGSVPNLSDRNRFPAAAGPVDDPGLRRAWGSMTAEDQQAITRVYVNMGKAIAAYERLLIPGPSRFDRYVEAILSGDTPSAASSFTPDEEAGLRLFIGRGHCTRCHNGPLLTNHGFHNTGLSHAPGRAPDRGRWAGVEQVVRSEFNCLSRYSDAPREACVELRFIKRSDPHFDGGFKTPTLRNVSRTSPYMHDGRFTTLRAVLDHYNNAPSRPDAPTELVPLSFSNAELAQLEKFLRTLDGQPQIPNRWLTPPRE